jgi:hypothetical protein
MPAAAEEFRLGKALNAAIQSSSARRPASVILMRPIVCPPALISHSVVAVRLG